MEKFIEEVADYVKCDTEDLPLLRETTAAAVAFIEETTGKQFDLQKILFRQAAKMVVDEWFSHHGTTTTENLKELPPSVHLQRILNMISLGSEYGKPTEVIE